MSSIDHIRRIRIPVLLAALFLGCQGEVVQDQLTPPPIEPPVGAPKIIRRISGDGQAGLVGTLLPMPLVARVFDSVGNPFPGVTVSWAAGQGGQLERPETETDSTGTVRAEWLLGGSSGAQSAAVTSPVGTITFQSHAAAILDSIRINPANTTLSPGGSQRFLTQFFFTGGSGTASLSYSATAGSIDTAGNYLAGTAAGSFRVIASANDGAAADTAIVNVVNPVATLQSIAIIPSQIAVPSGGNWPFALTGLMSDGTTISPAASWSARRGTISSSGLYTAPSSAGADTVSATSAGLAAKSVVTVTTSTTNPKYPHEPSGYVRFAENNFSTLPAPAHGSVMSGPNMGLWGNTAGSEQHYYAGNYAATVDATGPQSPDTVFSTRFPTGLPAGIAPVQMYGWDGSNARKNKLYVSMWIKLVGSDFECNPVNTKLGFIAYGINPSSGGQNEGYFRIMGNGTQNPTSSFNIRFTQQGHIGRDLLQNLATGKLMTSGVWHRWEVVMELNTLGQANGIFKWWVDGTQTHNYTDMVYINTANTTPFNLWKWNPTWGGGDGPIKHRDDFIEIDHVYLSGQ